MGNPGDSGSQQFLPFSAIIINQALKVGYIDHSRRIASDIKIAIMSLIILSGKVPEKGITILRMDTLTGQTSNR